MTEYDVHTGRAIIDQQLTKVEELRQRREVLEARLAALDKTILDHDHIIFDVVRGAEKAGVVNPSAWQTLVGHIEAEVSAACGHYTRSHDYQARRVEEQRKEYRAAGKIEESLSASDKS
jgi:hypothetical protein